MALSYDLLSQFVKATTPAPAPKKDTTVYGTVVVSDGRTYVKLDGSEQLTPVSSTTAVSNDERVTVMIKDHSAVVTGNITSPAAKDSVVSNVVIEQTVATDLVAVSSYATDLLNLWPQLSDFLSGKVDAERLYALKANIDDLVAKTADIDTLKVEDLTAKTAKVDELYSAFAEFGVLEADEFKAAKADIEQLRSHTGTFMNLTTEKLNAVKATVKELNAQTANIAFANIDFANIGKSWIDEFYAKTGIVQDLTLENGVVVKELVGVTISADSIKTGSLTADRLVVRGDDGLYYKLNVSADGTKPQGVTDEELKNGLHGSNIIAKTITAEKMSVSELTAFASYIANFKMGIDGEGENAVGHIYSVPKDSVNNTTRGVYLDSSGQMNVGDGTNFIKLFQDDDGQYKLKISASEIEFKATNLKIGARNLIRNSATLIYDDYGFRGVSFTAEIVDGVLTIGPETSGTAEIIDNVLVVTGNATASIENSILIVK